MWPYELVPYAIGVGVIVLVAGGLVSGAYYFVMWTRMRAAADRGAARYSGSHHPEDPVARSRRRPRT